MQQITLTPEENAALAPKIARLEGLAAGYQAGIEEAKRLLVRELLEKRNNDAITQSKYAASGSQASCASTVNQQVQSAGAGNEPERADGGRAGDVFNRSLFPIDGTTGLEFQRPFGWNAAHGLTNDEIPVAIATDAGTNADADARHYTGV